MLANENAKKNKGVEWRRRDPQTLCVHVGAQFGRYHGSGAKVSKTMTLNQTEITASRSDFRDRILLPNRRPPRPTGFHRRMKFNTTTGKESPGFYFHSFSWSAGAHRHSRPHCRRRRWTGPGSAGGPGRPGRTWRGS